MTVNVQYNITVSYFSLPLRIEIVYIVIPYLSSKELDPYKIPSVVAEVI